MPGKEDRSKPAAVLVIVEDGYALADPLELYQGVSQ